MNDFFAGTTEGLAAIEAIIEHISYVVNADSLEVRLANFPKNSPLVKYVNDMKTWADIDNRKKEIKDFNQVLKQYIYFVLQFTRCFRTTDGKNEALLLSQWITN